MEQFAATLELKTVNVSQRLIAGYAAVHHSIDRVKDIIDPSASAKAVSRLSAPSDVAVFIGHNAAGLPVGIPQQIEATGKGLYTETYILKGPAGDNLLAVAKDLMDHGQSLGMSIGYKTHDSRSERAGNKSIRRLMDYSLKEYSYAAPQAIAHPEALVSAIKSRQRPGENEVKMQYRVEQREASWVVLCDQDADGDEDDNQVVGTYSSQETANAVATALRMQMRPNAQDDADEETTAPQADKTAPPAAEGALKATWSAAQVNDLKDSCFLYVEDGTKDDDGKTVPRSKRHFPYKDADGKVDVAHLRNAIARIPQSDLPADLKTRLQARARRLLAQAQGSDGKTADLNGDEPAEWKSGAALAYYGLAARLSDLAEGVASDFKHMDSLSQETKDYQRVRPQRLAEVRAVHAELGKLLEFADTIERGEDGQQRVALYQRKLALSEV